MPPRGPRILAASAAALASAAAAALTGEAGPVGPPPAAAQTGAGGVRLVEVARFDDPTDVVAAPGDNRRLFVTEQGGSVHVVRDGRRLDRPFLDIDSRVLSGGERGLLSIAFAPDYRRSRRFYVYFTDNTGDIVVQEYKRSPSDPDVAARRSKRQVLRQDHRQFSNHNGGDLHFGPDGLLYVSLGDGGSGGDPNGNGQSLGTLLGKLLRIDPRKKGRSSYRVPASNPFRRVAGARAAIYAYGLRNPYRFSFDRETGALTLTDVGQGRREEVNYRPRGRGRGVNFGWNRFEGTLRYSEGDAPGHVPPVLEQDHRDGWCAIIGGFVVRDPALPSLGGRYVYGDNCLPEVRSARLASAGAEDDRPLGLSIPGLSSFGQDRRGRIYATSLRGPLYLLAPR